MVSSSEWADLHCYSVCFMNVCYCPSAQVAKYLAPAHKPKQEIICLLSYTRFFVQKASFEISGKSSVGHQEEWISPV